MKMTDAAVAKWKSLCEAYDLLWFRQSSWLWFVGAND